MSTTSWGSLLAGEELAVREFGEAPPKSILLIPARSGYQIILMNSSITNHCTCKENGNQRSNGVSSGGQWEYLLRSEDVGVFVGIVWSF